MRFNNSYIKIFLRTILLFAVLFALAFFLIKSNYLGAALITPFISYMLIDFFRFQKRTQDEVKLFADAIRYRDFSRHFNEKKAPDTIQDLRKSFNDINTVFREVSKEKETQYQYLQKILELVDTGILSYEVESGNVMWMNETLKRLIEVPYLKTVQSLIKRDKGLFEEVTALQPGDSKIITIHVERTSFKALLSATAFQTDGKSFKLIAFQNVNEALDVTESKAWQQLLRVMTHEIMNSIAPISSLADTLKNRLQAASENLHNETVEDLELGIDTIKKRSEGLLKFAQTYRNLNRITTLNLQTIFISDLFGNLHRLMQPTFQQKGIEFEIILKNPDLQMQGDLNLLEQVFINLIVNAIEAVKESEAPKIILSADQLADKKVLLKISDNGHGMEDEVLDKIFIPFFSTKKNGSGIGLSLCKQIVMLHRGNIQVQSTEDKGSVFSLQFV